MRQQTMDRYLLCVLCFSMISIPHNITAAQGWNIGLQQLKIKDPVNQHEIDTLLWYPTTAAMRAEAIGPARFNVALNGAPADELRGVILISHGFSGSFLGHNDTAQALASNGYLVTTPTHPDIPGLKTGKPQMDPLVLRPRQLQVVLDYVMRKTEFATSNAAIGIVGYSLGTYTTLAALGAKVDLTGLEGYCDANGEDELLCSADAKERFARLTPHLPTPNNESANKIKAAILLAPAYGPLFTRRSMAAVTAPLLMYRAENDEELDAKFNAQHIQQLLPDNTELRTVAGAGHYTFMAPCPPAMAKRIPAICNDATGVDRAAIHRQLNRDIVSFFDQQLQ